MQYFRVIYRDCLQVQAIQRAIAEVTRAIDIYTNGERPGPWIADAVARDASQLLFDLVISFKNKKFRNEREWRIVCRPKLNPASSAPAMADENFNHLIRTGEKRFIELTTPAKSDWPSILLRPAVPFSSVQQRPHTNDMKALAEIREMLNQNGRQDIPVE
jgi:hypothetical protein